MLDKSKCLECNSEIIENKKFCNRSCAAKYNNRKFPKTRYGREKPKCLTCNTNLSRYNQKYCDNKCQMEYQAKHTVVPKILLGDCTNKNTLKRYIKSNFGSTCKECGIGEEWNGKTLVLQLDHMDGNSDNNQISNLRLLCPNCHSQTENFGSKGVGSSYKKMTKRNKALRRYKGYEQ